MVDTISDICRLILRFGGVYHVTRCIKSTPPFVLNPWTWIVRKIVEPWRRLRCIIRHQNGARFILSDDLLDSQILSDTYGIYRNLFFPEEVKSVPPGECILDVGAHHGIYSVAALQQYPGTTLIAVEPDPEAVAKLEANIRLNKMENRCEIIAAAVGHTEGVALLERSPDGSWANKIVPDHYAGPSIRVQVRQIGSILRGRCPYLVKTNSEGGEFALLSQLFDSDVKPKYIILLAHASEGPVDDLICRLIDAGYSVRPEQSTPDQPRYVCSLKTDAWNGESSPRPGPPARRAETTSPLSLSGETGRG